MFLALDIGNSTVVAALFEGATKSNVLSIPSTVKRTEAETWEIIESFLSRSKMGASSLQGVAISSVVPFYTSRFAALFNQKLGKDPLIISGLMDVGLTIHYDNPATLGPDRICSAVAAYSKYGGPIIVVDFGTATTYGVVSANGDFLGGAISLGMKSAAEALLGRTALLPNIELRLPPSPICTDTVEAMQAGTMLGAVDAFEGMIQRLRRQLGTQAKVIATGGLSPLMKQHSQLIDVNEPTLVLEGVRLIFERSIRQNSKAVH
jgi:type III pantothenate kinase